MSSAVNSDIADLEGWLALLMDCKQLPENDVQKLCEKVKLKIEILYCFIIFIVLHKNFLIAITVGRLIKNNLEK